jgi:TolB protein
VRPNLLIRVSVTAVAVLAAVPACASKQPASTPSQQGSGLVGNAAGGTASPNTSPAPPRWGTLVYLPNEGSSPWVTLTLWRPGGGDPEPSQLRLDEMDAGMNATVSPDGQRVAWVDSGDGNDPGALTVANVDGSGQHVLLNGATIACEPSWSPDGNEVYAMMVTASAAHQVYVNVGSGQTTPVPRDIGCHMVWSGDGQSIAYADGQGHIVTAHADGSSRRNVPNLGVQVGGRRSFTVLSLSAHGGLAAINVHTGDRPDGDIVRILFVNEIVDTATGATRRLPVSGELLQAYFLPAGGLLVRVRDQSGIHDVLVSHDLSSVLFRADEPPALASSVLLAYIA